MTIWYDFRNISSAQEDRWCDPFAPIWSGTSYGEKQNTNIRQIPQHLNYNLLMKSPEINSNKRPNNYDNIKSQSQAALWELWCWFCTTFVVTHPGGAECPVQASPQGRVLPGPGPLLSACKRGDLPSRLELEEAIGVLEMD